VAIGYIFPVLVCLDQEKSGSPGPGDVPTEIATIKNFRLTQQNVLEENAKFVSSE
jgi:hypothetical protein